MEGSISEISGWPNSEEDEKNVIDEVKAHKYGSFTFTIYTNSESLREFADNFPEEDKFEEMLQANLQVWQKRTEASQLDGGFWLNKPA